MQKGLFLQKLRIDILKARTAPTQKQKQKSTFLQKKNTSKFK